MKEIVVDASVAMTWCFPDENSGYAHAVLDELSGISAVVPALWTIEVANALAVGERRKRITGADSSRFVDLVSALSIRFDSRTAGRALSHALPLARAYGLSAYDATYLELAMRESAPLATLDDRLRAAAEASGVLIYQPA